MSAWQPVLNRSYYSVATIADENIFWLVEAKLAAMVALENWSGRTIFTGNLGPHPGPNISESDQFFQENLVQADHFYR